MDRYTRWQRGLRKVLNPPRHRYDPAGGKEMSSTRAPVSLGDAISTATLGIALITAILYVAGWTYVYYYFDRFRIPLLLLDVPIQHYLVYGALVLYKSPITGLLVCAIAFALLALAVRWIARIGRTGFSVVIIIVVGGAFAFARLGGIATALTDFSAERASDYAAYPRVHIALKGDAVDATKALGDIVSSDSAKCRGRSIPTRCRA